jgi:hypothetical protein
LGDRTLYFCFGNDETAHCSVSFLGTHKWEADIYIGFSPALHLQRTFNPILHTAWLNIHALTLKRNTAKYYFGEKSSVLHTFLKICCESRKI